MHANGARMTCLYRSDWSDAELKNLPVNQTVPVKYIDGRATVRIDLPPAGMDICVQNVNNPKTGDIYIKLNQIFFNNGL